MPTSSKSTICLPSQELFKSDLFGNMTQLIHNFHQIHLFTIQDEVDTGTLDVFESISRFLANVSSYLLLDSHKLEESKNSQKGQDFVNQVVNVLMWFDT
jgi:hypothetical protein